MDETFVEAARNAGVRDAKVLDALRHVRRSDFVPASADEPAVVDAPVPLPCDQTTSQPSLVALMVEALALEPKARVLEIGTGYGFECALLSQLAAHVWSIEWWPELADAAKANLARTGITNVDVVTGDGRWGDRLHAPYDGIIVAAQTETVPAELLAQLAIGGRLVAPVGPRGTQECIVLTKRSDGVIEQTETLGAVRFVPLLGG